MNKYKICVQFVNSTVRFDKEAQAAVKEAVKNYNAKSLIAKNPKQILDYRFSDDELTLELSLASEAELPNPSKALRLLSSYLVSETCLGESYMCGKQLFKMRAADSLLNSDRAALTQSADTSGSEELIDKEFKSLNLEEQMQVIYSLLLEIRGKL